MLTSVLSIKFISFLYHTCHLCTTLTEQTIFDDETPCEKEKIQLIIAGAPFVNIVHRD